MSGTSRFDESGSYLKGQVEAEAEVEVEVEVEVERDQ